MKAALEALANLSSSSENTAADPQTTTTTSTTIDARSVRVAIEQDALYQARLLEGELRKSVERVGGLRVEIKAVSDVADEVCRCIDKGVVDVTSHKTDDAKDDGGGMMTTMRMLSEENDDEDRTALEEKEKSPLDITTENDAPDAKSEIEEEERLAALLANAFHKRDEAHCRFEAITIFMEKFDVSENDSYLLECYNFDSVFDESHNTAGGGDDGGGIGLSESNSINHGETTPTHLTGGLKDGTAFLDALQRVSKIRRELATSLIHPPALSHRRRLPVPIHEKRHVSSGRHLGTPYDGKLSVETGKSVRTIVPVFARSFGSPFPRSDVVPRSYFSLPYRPQPPLPLALPHLVQLQISLPPIAVAMLI